MSLDPRVRILAVFCVGVLAVVLERAQTLGVLALLSVIPLFWVRVAWWRPAVIAVLAVTWSNLLSQGLFYSMYPKTPWIAVGPVVLYAEGVAYGLLQSLRWAAMVGAGLSLVSTTPTSRLLAALVRWKIPFGLAFMAVTAWRFVPMVAEEFRVAWRAQQRRRPGSKVRLALFRPVIAACLRRARGLAEALDARGFDPVAPRTELYPLVWRWTDTFAAILLAGPTVALVAVRLLYWAYTADLWWSSRWMAVYAWARTGL